MAAENPQESGRNLGFLRISASSRIWVIEESSVAAYLEEYYEKHPLDNSYEGILARRSGLTKGTGRSLFLDKLDYFAKVVDYDPDQ